MGLFRKKKANFYDLLLHQAEKVEEGIQGLLNYMRNPEESIGNRVLEIEEEADELRRIVVEEINRSFVTPIDREDIFELSRAVDDIVDYGKSTVEEMMIFNVTPNKHMVVMAEGLYEGAKAIRESIEAIPQDVETARERVIFAKKRENFVEHCYREALVELFKKDNVVEILKIREILRHLSNAADRGDQAANIIGNILVKAF